MCRYCSQKSCSKLKCRIVGSMWHHLGSTPGTEKSAASIGCFLHRSFFREARDHPWNYWMLKETFRKTSFLAFHAFSFASQKLRHAAQSSQGILRLVLCGGALGLGWRGGARRKAYVKDSAACTQQCSFSVDLHVTRCVHVLRTYKSFHR